MVVVVRGGGRGRDGGGAGINRGGHDGDRGVDGPVA